MDSEQGPARVVLKRVKKRVEVRIQRYADSHVAAMHDIGDMQPDCRVLRRWDKWSTC